MELQPVLTYIERATDDILHQIMRSVERRYAAAYPQWDVLYIAVHKDPDMRKSEINDLISFLQRDL